MPVKFFEYADSARFELIASGHISKADYDAVIGPLQAFIDTHETIHLIEVIESFAGFDPALLVPGFQFDMRYINNISHVALVTDIGWMSPFATATSAIMPTKLKTFPLDGLDRARAWLEAEAVTTNSS